MEKRRLDWWIASQGGRSRSQVKELIRRGAVAVNGERARDGAVKVGEEDRVEVEGRILPLQAHLYLMLNKPQGVVCATRDSRHRTVLDLTPPELRRKGLFPAGRLDRDTEGFVLLTDDGPFAHRILSPKNHVPKTYRVRLDQSVPPALVEEFAGGVDLGGGERSSPARLVLGEEDRSWAELTIFEGMYHQVKRMFAAHGLAVTYLKRIRIGGVDLDPNLAPGACRVMLHKEVENI